MPGAQKPPLVLALHTVQAHMAPKGFGGLPGSAQQVERAGLDAGRQQTAAQQAAMRAVIVLDEPDRVAQTREALLLVPQHIAAPVRADDVDARAIAWPQVH